MRIFPLLVATLASIGCQHPNASARPAAVDRGYVTVERGRLYYEAAGAGPAVIFINGANLDARMWDAQFAALAGTHRVVRYDERGFGRSSPADVPYAAEQDLATLLDSLRVTHASLVGLSLGGRIALDFSLAHPTVVQRLVLAAPGISGWRFGLGDTSWAGAWRSARARADSIGMARAWLASDWMKPAMEQARLQPILRELIVASAGYWQGLVQHGDTEREAMPPALGRTENIHVPTLIIVGSRDVPDIGRIADTLMATIPRARRLTLYGVGHLVNLEDPERFTAAVDEFLRR